MDGDADSDVPAPAFEARLHAEGVEFDDRDAVLLRTVAAEGSLNAAASALGRSYSRAHGRLGELEEAFGPLVERTRGGAGGGGSRLTDGARALLARYDRLRAEFTGVAEATETVVEGRVVERTGELAVVETDVGRLRALTPPDAEAVQVTLRADAVTLHAPADAPPAGGTSARNRLEGVVGTVEVGEAVGTVTVGIDGRDGNVSLAALVTVESVERLELAPGDPVVVTFKATATRAVPR
ncbi:TOBE domain-containing protein [Salinirubellus sp. GCM10025818]|uniref:TOBE domain-containing protein n=1 Tax=Salinirubellus TaxID=2162630 RepID=UPI0030CBC912